MIEAFMQSWDLFGHIYLTGWLIALTLSLVGVLVVARDQIFLSAAVSQASTLGIALGMWLGALITSNVDAWVRSDGFLAVTAVAFAIFAALLTAYDRSAMQESTEAVTGWAFLVSASLATLLLAHSPHGMEEINRLLASTLIGATQIDVWVFAALFTITLFLLILFQGSLVLVTIDPNMATAVGLRSGAWRLTNAAWLGLAAGLSMRATGLLYTFGCLVLPALVAKNICREIRSMFIAAPIAALFAVGLGFILANHYDYPPAQMVVALLCLMVIMAWGFRSLSLRSRGERRD